MRAYPLNISMEEIESKRQAKLKSLREKKKRKKKRKTEKRRRKRMQKKVIAITKDELYGPRTGLVCRGAIAIMFVVFVVASFGDLVATAVTRDVGSQKRFVQGNCTVDTLLLEVRENVSLLFWVYIDLYGLAYITSNPLPTSKITDAVFLTSGRAQTTLYRALVDVTLSREDAGKDLTRCAMQYSDGSYDSNRTRVEAFLDKLKGKVAQPCWYSTSDISLQDSTCQTAVQLPVSSSSWLGLSRGM